MNNKGISVLTTKLNMLKKCVLLIGTIAFLSLVSWWVKLTFRSEQGCLYMSLAKN